MPVVPDARARAATAKLVREHIDALSRLLGESRIDYTLLDTSHAARPSRSSATCRAGASG